MCDDLMDRTRNNSGLEGENSKPSTTAENHNINPSATVSKARENNDRMLVNFWVESQQLELLHMADTHNKTPSATAERAMVQGSDTQPKKTKNISRKERENQNPN